MDLRVYYQNVRSIKRKSLKFSHNLALSAVDWDLIILTETWLDSDILDAELGLKKYNVYRSDRCSEISSRGGGVLVAVKKTLASTRCINQDEESSLYEKLFIRISCHGASVIVGAVYFPPLTDLSQYQEFILYAEELRCTDGDADFLMIGDFNLSGIEWNISEELTSYSFKPSATSRSGNVCSFLTQFCDRLHLRQRNSIKNDNGNVLDLCFSSVNCSVQETLDSLSKVDPPHPVLEISMHIPIKNTRNYNQKSRKHLERLNFKKCNYKLAKQLISAIDWESLAELEPLEFYDHFYKELNSIVTKTVPVEHIIISTFEPWFSTELINLTIRKKIIHRIYKSNKCQETRKVFSDLRLKCTKLSSELYKSYIKDVEEGLRVDARKFWHFINDKKKDRGLPDIMKLGNIVARGSESVSNLFASFFESVYLDNEYKNTEPNLELIHEYYMDNLSSITDVENINISVHDINMALKDLKPSMFIGPDGIPAVFIKNCSEELLKPLFLMFGKSIDSGLMHPFWKMAYINPIHKKGDKCKIDNYRPVSKMSAITTLLDKIITWKLSAMIYSFISPKQHGFVPGRSTLSNLTILTNYIHKSFRAGGQTDVIYLDFRKAFDLVNHKILLYKLKAYNIPAKLITWLANFVTGRSLSVVIDSDKSKPFIASSGVPQGSHLGPILFLIFINDIAQIILYSLILLFADDVKLCLNICTRSDCGLLQQDLSSVVKWCNLNLLGLNFGKCELLSFSRRTTDIIYNYSLSDAASCKRVTTVKDLGIIFDRSLRFDDHLQYVISKANRVWSMIVRNTANFSKTESVRHLYISLVKSTLMYGSVIWRPETQLSRLRLERIQHKVIRHLARIDCTPMHRFNHDYREMAAKYKLPSISSSMDVSDILFLYKIMSDKIKSPELKLLVPVNNVNYVLRRNMPFYPIRVDNNYSEREVVYRCCKLFNNCAQIYPGLSDFTSGITKIALPVKKCKLKYE